MEPNWKPLEEKLGKKRCVGFMYMGRINGINLYKHGIARIHLNLDDLGRCYVLSRNSLFEYEQADFAAELARVEAALERIGESLESAYDEDYMVRKSEALIRAGMRLVRFTIKPENISIN